MFRKALGRRLSLIPTLIAIAGVLLPWCSAQETDTQVETHFLAAQQDQQQGQLDAAVHEYQAVLRLQPGLPEAYVNLGLVYYAQAKFEDSARALATAHKIRPAMRGVSLWLGIDSVRLNRPAQGAALLREAVAQDPNDKLAQSWLGTALWDEGQADAALLQLRKAAAQFPEDPDLLFALDEAYGKAAKQETEQLLEASAGTELSDRIYGEIYAGEHDWTKAEGHLRRAIERDPRSVDAHLELAAVLIDQVHLPEAQEQLEQARALAPHGAAVLAREGELLLLMQQQAPGLASIDAALNINSGEALDALGLPVEDGIDQLNGSEVDAGLSILCHKTAEKLDGDPASSSARSVAVAALYRLGGDEDSAMREYRKDVVAHNPNPSKNLFAQAMTAIHQHHDEEAEASLLRWLLTHPGDLNARYELVLARRHIFMAQLIHLLAVAPDSYHMHQLLGQFYVDREEDDKALAEYLAVAAVQPDLPGVHFWLGHLYWKHGDADHAFAELTRELQLDPGHPEANGELGAVLMAKDRAEDAIPHLELAIRSKSDLWPAYPQLGRAYVIEKNYPRAEEVLKHALAHDPDGSTHYQLGLVLRAEGKTAEATQAFAQVRAIKNERMATASTGAAAEKDPKQ